MLKFSSVLALASLVTAACGCASAAYADDEFFAPYFQRRDTVTLSAGNAKAVNAAAQIIDPWPRYVGNRRIPADGQRMVAVHHRYRDVGCLTRAPLPMQHPAGAGIGGIGVGGGGLGVAVGGGGGERAGCDDGPGTSGPAGSFSNSNNNNNNSTNFRGVYVGTPGSATVPPPQQ